MRRLIPVTKQFSTKQNLTNAPAFAFLSRCSKSRFDLTSSESLALDSAGISFPKKILDLITSFNPSDFTAFKGESRGEEYVLNECKKFFNRSGIKSELSNVSLCENILKGIDNIYTILDLNKDRKILVPTPTFGYYFKNLEQRNIGFETLTTRATDNFLPNPEELEKSILQTGAVALLLNYPNNPTGAVMTRDCAQRIAEVVSKHNVFVISDEAFINNPLSNKKHFPIAAVEGMLDRCFTVTSLTKSVFLSKGAFCTGPQEIINNFTKLGGYPTKRDQKVMAASLEDSEENRVYFEQCRQYYASNIQLVKTKTSELNKKFCEQFGEEKDYVKPFISDPDATNVYLLDFSGLRGKTYNGKAMNSGLDAATWLLDSASIGSVPGECSLFDEKEMLVRITLNHSPHEIGLAFDSAITAASAIQNPLVAQTSNAADGEEIIPSNSLKTSKKSVSKVVESELKGISSDKF